MATNLVIVESPAKAKTIERYLGKEFKVIASYGHVRDLIPKNGAVDPNDHFAMKYQLIEKNAHHVEDLIKATKKSNAIYLATDPDREGEAISWHVCEILREKKLIEKKLVHRVVFYEITKTAVNEAIANPRELSQSLINAQQARRALDFLVGFNLSPLLWKKIRRGLSAGRVQSPALRMIVEREEEIEKFKSQEYWTIEADLKYKEQDFAAKLSLFQGKKIEQFSITNEDQASQTRTILLNAGGKTLEVVKIDKRQRKRNPAAPFITSTLQQEAVRKLGFTAKRAMRTAQQLYEGVDIGMGSVGLITYMRTDSVNLAAEALEEIRDLIVKRYGKHDLPNQPRVYKTKSKNAQEAHEAIRPTSAKRTPEQVKEHLTADQFKLYNLIWKRTVASQMMHATVDTVAVDLACGEGNLFRANGSTITDPGFIKVYQEGDDSGNKDKNEERLLPAMKEGDKIPLQEIRKEQHFTEPPPRFSEASLVKALEEHGIGRPSTYATIISTLQTREYVIIDAKRFRPTDVGRIVNKFLTNYFTQYVDYDFTAKLEDGLDAIARGEKQWVPLLDEFWEPFKSLIDNTEKNVKRKDVTQEEIDETCPECNKPLVIRLGRNGRFVGCTGYPDCSYTRSLENSADSSEPEIVVERNCPKCNSALQVKVGRYGKFIGCSGYPNCKYIEPLEKPKDTGVTCPECKKGSMLLRKSRKGKIFYSCSGYPKCRYATWDEPFDEACPKCKWPILTLKTTKRSGTFKLCPQKECDFREKIEDPDKDPK